MNDRRNGKRESVRITKDRPKYRDAAIAGRRGRRQLPRPPPAENRSRFEGDNFGASVFRPSVLDFRSRLTTVLLIINYSRLSPPRRLSFALDLSVHSTGRVAFAGSVGSRRRPLLLDARAPKNRRLKKKYMAARTQSP